VRVLEGEDFGSYMMSRTILYVVRRDANPHGWACTCPGYLQFDMCKHEMAFAIKFKANIKVKSDNALTMLSHACTNAQMHAHTRTRASAHTHLACA
jgi:hypothetical protein